MPLTPQQEQEIYPILDKALALAPGKGVLHCCTPQRAEYLSRMIRGLRYDTAIESLLIYQPGEPLYGVGMYSCLWVESNPQGLLATNLPTPHINLAWQLIMCVATESRITLNGASSNQARQRLARMQKKHPEIMNHVFIEDSTPPIAVHAANVGEELLIVDIDMRPDSHLRGPTDEQIAKAGMPMKNPSKFT